MSRACFVRLGDHTINLAAITHIQWYRDGASILFAHGRLGLSSAEAAGLRDLLAEERPEPNPPFRVVAPCVPPIPTPDFRHVPPPGEPDDDQLTEAAFHQALADSLPDGAGPDDADLARLRKSLGETARRTAAGASS